MKSRLCAWLRRREIWALLALAALVIVVYGAFFRMLGAGEVRGQPPREIVIEVPSHDALFAAGSLVQIEAVAHGSDLERLEVWVDETPLFLSQRNLSTESDEWRAEGNWRAGWPGQHQLHGRAFAADGTVVFSSPVILRVMPAFRIVFTVSSAADSELGDILLWAVGEEPPMRLVSSVVGPTNPQPGPAGSIAYTGFGEDKKRHIWLYQQGSESPTLYIGGDVDAHSPSWSPDGTKLAFVADWSGSPQLWLVDVAYGVTSLLSDEEDGAEWPAWSGDGRGLVYVAGPEGHRGLVNLSLVDGARRELPRVGIEDLQPACSSARNEIAFIARLGAADELYVSNIDGREARRIQVPEGRIGHPQWSPDGQWLLFTLLVQEGGGTTDRFLYLVRRDGEHLMRLTPAEWMAGEGAWVPDNWE